MAETTNIAWTDSTMNPWIGCSKVSPGCDHCYAEGEAKRRGWAQWGPGEPRMLTSDNYWKQPLIWDRKAKAAGRRHRVFCASLADVFDNEVPQEWRVRLLNLIDATPNLTWLLLTKRIGNAAKMLPRDPLPNIWLGTSVVNQEEADRDIPKLRDTPAEVRFISYEPALGAVDFTPWLPNPPYEPLGIDWIIAGGESGRGARPMHPNWARSVRDQCKAAGVPFFFKQWGEYVGGGRDQNGWHHYHDNTWSPNADHDFGDGCVALRVGKKKADNVLDGARHMEFPTP